MSSPVDIVNSALGKLGVEFISSLSENSKAARLANQQYDKIRDALLSGHLWNFAMTRVVLALVSDTTIYGYMYRYQYPTDCLRFKDLSDGHHSFKVEANRYIHTNMPEAKGIYVRKITDVAQMPAYFREALAWALADDWCYALVQKQGFSELTANRAKDALRHARSMDAQEGTPEDWMEDTWLNSRIAFPLGDSSGEQV